MLWSLMTCSQKGKGKTKGTATREKYVGFFNTLEMTPAGRDGLATVGEGYELWLLLLDIQLRDHVIGSKGSNLIFFWVLL